jgi:tellurite resistance protein
MRDITEKAIDDLCEAFERGGYNPTPVIDLGVLVAHADGTVDDTERALLREIFQTLLDTQLSPEVVDVMISASVEVIAAAGVDARTRLVAAILQDCDAAEPGLRVALAIAFASEGLSPSERAVVERLADLADVPRDRVEDLIRDVKRHADEGGPVSARQSLAPLSTRSPKPPRTGE